MTLTTTLTAPSSVWANGDLRGPVMFEVAAVLVILVLVPVVIRLYGEEATSILAGFARLIGWVFRLLVPAAVYGTLTGLVAGFSAAGLGLTEERAVGIGLVVGAGLFLRQLVRRAGVEKDPDSTAAAQEPEAAVVEGSGVVAPSPAAAETPQAAPAEAPETVARAVQPQQERPETSDNDRAILASLGVLRDSGLLTVAEHRTKVLALAIRAALHRLCVGTDAAARAADLALAELGPDVAIEALVRRACELAGPEQRAASSGD